MAFDKILVVDDEPALCQSLREYLEARKFQVLTSHTVTEAKQLLAQQAFDLLLLDERLPDGRGSDLLNFVLTHLNPQPFVVMMSGYGSVESAVDCIHHGAYDFVLKPFSLEQVEIAIKRAESFDQLLKLNRFFSDQLIKDDELIGNAPVMQALKNIIRKVAPTAATVLITGENGTGKELVAREVFRLSRLHNRPFIRVNCAAISESLIESEFFGHEKGAFTGATERRNGRFELADGGTILLDEIGEISPKIQAKLLRVLQEKEFERVGGTKTIKVNVRVIATTNRDLQASVQQGHFREDLFYRLSVFPLHVPPLRERGDDILLLAQAFLKRFAQKHTVGAIELAQSAIDALLRHPWPGNVRELHNAVERAVILADPGEALTAAHFQYATQPQSATARSASLPAFSAPHPADFQQPVATAQPNGQSPAPSTPPSAPAAAASPKASLNDVERQHIFGVLLRNGGNRTASAKELNITTRTLRNKLKLYRDAGYSIP